MVKRISFSLLFLSFLCCSYAQEVRDAQQFSSLVGDTLSTSEIDRIISDASDIVYKKNSKHYLKKGIYRLQLLDRKTGQERTTGTLEAIIETHSVCLSNFKVLGGEVNGIEEDTLSPMIPYMTKNDIYRMVQVAPIMERDPFWKYVRTPFVRPSSNKDKDGYKLDHSGRVTPDDYTDMPINIGPSRTGAAMQSPHGNDDKGPTVDGIPYKKKYQLPYASERYYVSGKKIGKADSQKVYKIELNSKHPNSSQEVVGVVEIDDKNRLLRYDGELLGQSMWVMKDGKRNAVRLNCQSHVEYTYHRGFMEVETSRCTVTYGNHEVEILLTNLNEPNVKSKKKVKAGNNLIKAIKMAGYDPNLRKEG